MYMYVIKTVFSPPVNVFYVNLIFRPAKEPKRIEGKIFSSPQFKKRTSGHHGCILSHKHIESEKLEAGENII